jgi:hypothetical protein
MTVNVFGELELDDPDLTSVSLDTASFLNSAAFSPDDQRIVPGTELFTCNALESWQPARHNKLLILAATIGKKAIYGTKSVERNCPFKKRPRD